MIGFQAKNWQSSEVLSQVSPLLQEIRTGSASNIGNAFFKLFTFYMGTPNEAGALEMFAAQHSNFKPMEWAGKLEQLMECICPDSFVFQRAFRNKEARMVLNNVYAPQGMDSNSFQKQAISLGLRTMYQGFSVPVLDGFYIMLAQAIYRSESNIPNLSQFDQLTQDELFSSLSRNPFLILLRKHLQFLGPSQKTEMTKIVESLRLYLTNQVLMKYDLDRNKLEGAKNEGSFRSSLLSRESGIFRSISLKFKLKVHHIHALMLAFNSTPQYFTDYSRICLAFLEYFQQIGADSDCLQALIRSWIFSASFKNSGNVQAQIIKALQRANSHDGWFILQRQSLDSISAVENTKSSNIKVAQSFLKVFDKQSNWVPSASMFVSFAKFFKFLKSAEIFYPDFANRKGLISDMRENSIEQKAIRKIFVHINTNLVQIHRKICKTDPKEFTKAISLFSEMEDVIQSYSRQFLNSKSSEIGPSPDSLSYLKFKKVSEADLINMSKQSNIVSMDGFEKISPQSKRHLVSFYRRDPDNVWRAPTQSNEWIILYFLFFNVAKLVDLVTPGKRESPWLNIRWLANPINFFGLFLIIVALNLIFK